MKQKVTAFILRQNKSGHPEILLHEFATASHLPYRLPGGGVDAGETPEEAIHREIAEETGLTELQIVRKLGTQTYFKPHIQANVERHDFLLWINDAVPNEWTVTVQGEGEDAGDVFRLFWLDAHSLTNIDNEHAPFLTPVYLPELFITNSPD